MSKPSKHNAKEVARYYWQRVKVYPYSFIGICLVIPVTVLCGQFLPPLILARVLHRLSAGQFIAHQPLQSFGHEILIYASLVAFTGFGTWRIIDILGWKLEGSVLRDIARDVFKHLSEESADFHANNFSGSLVSQTNKILGSYVRTADATMYSTFPLIASLVFAGVIMWSRSPLYVILLMVFATLYIVVALIVSRPVRDAGSEHARAESKQTGYLADVVGNVMAVKSFAGEDYEQHEFAKATDFTHSKMKVVMRKHMRQMVYFGAVSRTISTMALVVSIISVVSYHADIATVFLILSYTSNIAEQLFQFSNSSLRNYNRSVGDAGEMVAILNTPAIVKDPLEPEPRHMNRGAIRFNDVGFTHKDADAAIFTDLNLRIKPGEKVGLIGPSGSGKTSLTRLLLRFSDIQAGSIEIDGQNIAKVTQADLRAAISYVPQEPILFHRTIAENIRYGRHEAAPEEIQAIARQANADEFVSSLPQGYETVVGERGVKLSGGQRQRVAIARAMLKNAPILVLDEATSALDSESEALIQEALWKLMEGRTAIVIAHRLSTIQKMDRILVLDKGKIVEEGSHKDLLYQKGVYAKLWNRQSGGFLEE
jgi:ATP-binding cassette subfamily B protein